MGPCQTATNETWILNIATNTMKPGPSLKNERFLHGCARIKDDSIIVVGGYDTSINNHGGYVKSTEILRIGDQEWTKGPDLKEGVTSNEVVKSNGEDYIAYSVAGKDEDSNISGKIYGLRSDLTEWELIDFLKDRRCCGSALNVPLRLIPWCDI